ncbi:NAD(P)H-binding protein [Companilactobacillus mishanensis]|uniref:SDR family NAD(P)-dependent oxidoreductase n=1 Tax=Companilactobacillus mishanensis TaxID=2486008 RepID=A0ABW9P9V5_9LACO|nr:NAD(P)H-binding protein [Companilactobacillus mishanensis]MQS45864.1 SDR family NAD(P)-dependent oxidoreductase [Companilactobacillus mishanensis]
MKYAITGSTGKFGRKAIEILLKEVDATDIVALARNEEKAKKLLPAEIEIRPGSYEDEAVLAKSLNDIDRLLFISSQPGGAIPRLQQHTNVINAAKSAGVKYVAYTSFADADNATAALAADHKATEKLIEASGLDYSFLRNNWYVENEMDVISAGAAGKPFVYAAGNGRAGWALERLYAEAAAKVITSDSPKNVYEFGGQMVTYADLAQAVKDATGKDFEVDSISTEQYIKNLQEAGMDQPTSEIIASMQTLIEDGNLDVPSTDLPDVLGYELPSLADSVKEALSK